MQQPGGSSVSRRALLAAGGVGLALAGGLVARNQIRHPHRDKRSQPDGRFRRYVLSCPHPAHDPVLMVAMHGGILSRFNLEIAVRPGLSSGAEAVNDMAAGHSAIAVAPALSWLPRLLGGLDARLACGLQSGSARLLVDRRSPIKRIEDLYRKSIGIADFGADRLFFSVMMRRKGMDPNRDVSWVQVPPDRFGDALAARQVQALVGHDPVIWQIRERFRLVELASSMTGSYGTRVSRVLGIRGDSLRADPQGAVALVLAMQEAAATVEHHLGETASLLADELPDMELPAIDRMLHAEGHAVHPVGARLAEQMAQYIDELKLIGLAPDGDDSGALARSYCASLIHR